jgi:hypothetical protein
LKDIIETVTTPLSALQVKWFFLKIKLLLFWNPGISKHYNFNMCDKFNEYQMFLCCEELWWLPWIWFVEWMACWCAYIWKDDPMYRNIWLIPWIHYIWHNWKLDDIIKKITYYQNHQDELQIIAKNGENFINNNFRPEKIAKTFFNDLTSLSSKYDLKSWKNGLKFTNSFIINHN